MKVNKFWNWQTVQNNDGDNSVETSVLFINGTIAEDSWFDDDVTPRLFKSELDNHRGDITIWINSPGGDCVAAAQIYNMLMEHKGEVTIKIDGIAASAASVIAMAGTRVLMSPVSMMMIHNPMTIAFGDREKLKQTLSMLDEYKESIINAYEIKTGMDRNKLSKLMDNETWMDVHTAMELGFCDEIMTRNSHNFDRNQLSNCYSKRQVEDTLINKLSKFHKENAEDKTDSSELLERLNLLKTWR